MSQEQADLAGLQLLKEHELLRTQFSKRVVLRAMAGNVNAYVQETLRAGRQVLVNLRPILEGMLRLGLLIDASGKAVGSLEEAGISTFGVITDSVKSQIEEIRILVRALRASRAGRNANS